MANKNVIRSIRISDEMLQLIERQPGLNFTEKWETLVTKCVWELPHKEQELQTIQKQIEREMKRLSEIRELCRQFDGISLACSQARSLLCTCLDKMEKL